MMKALGDKAMVLKAPLRVRQGGEVLAVLQRQVPTFRAAQPMEFNRLLPQSSFQLRRVEGQPSRPLPCGENDGDGLLLLWRRQE